MPSTPSASATSSGSRKIRWLGGAVVVACILWTAGWFAFASNVESRLPATLAGMTGPYANADCRDADIRGYPFRFGLFCETMAYTNPAEGISAQTGAFRSAAQFYRPGHIVAEVDGPFAFSAPGVTARADWQVLQTSIFAARNGLDRGSLDARNINVDVDSAALTLKWAMQAERLRAHARKNGPDLDVAVYGEQLQNNLVPGLTTKGLTLEATLPGQAGLLDMPYAAPAGAYQAILHRLALELDDASSLELSGPLQIGADGLISGNLEITLRNQQRLIEMAAELDTNLAEMLNRFGPLIGTLDTRPGDDGITLPLTITNNLVSLGIFPIGELPRF